MFLRKGLLFMGKKISVKVSNIDANDSVSVNIHCRKDNKTRMQSHSKEGVVQMTIEEACKMLEPMIHKIARKYSQQNLSLYEDLVSEGHLAVCENFKNFDPAKGASISTFMYPYIVHRCFEFASPNSFGMTSHYAKKNRLIAKAEETLLQLGIPTPTDQQILNEIGEDKISLLTISRCRSLSLNKRNVSFNDVNVNQDNLYANTPALQTESPESIQEKKIEISLLKEIMAQNLTDNEKKCLYMKYGVDLNQSYSIREIANHTNSTPDRVKQTINIALKRLRPILEEAYGLTDNFEKEKSQHESSIGVINSKVIDTLSIDIELSFSDED